MNVLPVAVIRLAMLSALLAAWLQYASASPYAPALPLTAGVRSEPVLLQSMINGRAASVWAISSGLPPLALAREIAEQWQMRGAGRVLLDQSPEWLIVSRFDGRRLESVQIWSNGATAKGYFTQWHDPAAQSMSDKRIAQLLPDSIRVLNRLSTGDLQAVNASMLGVSPDPIDSVARAIAERAQRAGMRQAEFPTPRVESDANTAASRGAMPPEGQRSLRFVAKNRELLLSLERIDSQTVVVIHYLEGYR